MSNRARKTTPWRAPEPTDIFFQNATSFGALALGMIRSAAANTYGKIPKNLTEYRLIKRRPMSHLIRVRGLLFCIRAPTRSSVFNWKAIRQFMLDGEPVSMDQLFGWTDSGGGRFRIETHRERASILRSFNHRHNDVGRFIEVSLQSE